MKRILLVGWLLLLANYSTQSVAAASSFDLEVPSGETLGIDAYVASSKTLLIWLPSERGFGDYLKTVFPRLARSGINVWAALLHDSYIIPTGQHSLDGIDIGDLLTLIDAAQRRGFDKVYLLGAYRGAALALKLAYRWQQLHPASHLLRGLIFLTPNLVRPLDVLGEDTAYLPITAYSNLPVYILQTEYSTKFARISDLARQLGLGGSPVFVQNLRGVINGYYLRPDDELTDKDRAACALLSVRVAQAIKMLQRSHAGRLHRSYIMDNRSTQPVNDARQAESPGLHPYPGAQKVVTLRLQNLNGRTFDLSDYHGQVVLVNFWATWCAPCIEEIPSLSRLNTRMQGKPFKIVAVNIGETAQKIRAFLQKIPANFEILLDPDNKTVRNWKVYAYPSSYIVDRKGRIHFAYRGALQWDSDNILDKIERLMRGH